MSKEDFYNMLLSLSTEEKTGRLDISCTEGSSINFGTLELKDGELVGAAYLNRSGKDAVYTMLALNIRDMRFMVVTVNGSGHSDIIPTVATCLQQLNTQVRQLKVKQQTEQVLSRDL